MLNARQIERNPESDTARLAGAIEESAESFVSAAMARLPSDTVQVTNGLTLTVDHMAKLILGEQLVHGHDISRAAHGSWEITAEDALRVIDGVISVAPEYLDQDAARSVKATYELRLGGGVGYRLEIDRGSATVGPAGAGVDCIITADPVAFLLVGYGRVGQWGQILRGRLRAGGRRPWLALRFSSLLVRP